MSKNQSWKTLATLLLVFVGGMVVIFCSFFMGGFPFPVDFIPQIIWLELAFLLILLGIPLFR